LSLRRRPTHSSAGYSVPERRRQRRSIEFSKARMSACVKPNWRAIAEGFTPALNAARTALAFPKGMPAGGLSFCGRGPWARPDVGSDFIRREASPCTAASRRSNSAALRICSDASRSDGKRGRGSAVAGASDRTGSSIALKRSGEASPRLRARVTI